MKFGLDLAQHQLTWEELVARARMGEDLGFEALMLFDHFKAGYGDPKGPCFEGWTALAALAALTTRIRLGLHVGGITYRPPALVAMEAVTVDHISNGRVNLEMGMAWFEEEHREFGFEFPSTRERAQRLDEGLTLMKSLMTEDEADFQGRYYRLEHASYHPRPIQKPYPPIWIGGCGERLTLPIVARHANVWDCNASFDGLRRKSGRLDQLAEEAGRDPRSIEHSTSIDIDEDWDKVRGQIESLAGIGFGRFHVFWPARGGAERVGEFAQLVMPDYA